jgi:hypothetical protein
MSEYVVVFVLHCLTLFGLHRPSTFSRKVRSSWTDGLHRCFVYIDVGEGPRRITLKKLKQREGAAPMVAAEVAAPVAAAGGEGEAADGEAEEEVYDVVEDDIDEGIEVLNHVAMPPGVPVT